MKATRLAVAALAALLWASEARAQVDVQGAGAAYTRGVAALHTNRYGDAVIEFEASYRLNPIPRVLYNLALAYRGAGRHLRAVETFERYLREQPAIPLDRRDAIAREVQELRVRVGVIACRVRPREARFRIDGELRECTLSVLVDPGERVLEVEAEGHRPARHRVRIGPGTEVDFRVELVSLAEVTPPREDPRASGDVRRADERPRSPPVYTRWWFWTIVGAVVAGGVTAGVVLANQAPTTPDFGQAATVEALTFR